MKFDYLLIGGVLLVFGSCVAKPPEKPATVIQLENPAQANSAEVANTTEETELIAEDDEGQLRAYEKYSSDYLAALSATGDLAEAEWNQAMRCRIATVARDAQLDAEKNNTGLEAELQKRLRAVNNDAKARAEGKKYYAHDAAGFADIRDPGADVIVLVTLLQSMQDGNPSFPLCSQNAGSLWRQVDQILEAADEMARTDPQSVPVRVPSEVAKDDAD